MWKKLIAVHATLLILILGGVVSLMVVYARSPEQVMTALMVLACAGMLGTLGVALYIIQRILTQRSRALERGHEALETRIAALHKKVDTLGDYSGSILRSTRKSKKVLEELKELDSNFSFVNSSVTRREHSHNGDKQEFSYFSPFYIPSTKIESKPNVHLPGRFAANQIGNEPSEWKFQALLENNEQLSERHVAVIGPEELHSQLEDAATISRLYPHFGPEQLDTAVSYLIIDELGINATPWAGVFDAQSTHLFRNLLKIMEAAKKRQIVIIVLASEVAAHNSYVVHDLASVVVDTGGPREALPWGTDLDLPIVDLCIKYRRGKNE